MDPRWIRSGLCALRNGRRVRWDLQIETLLKGSSCDRRRGLIPVFLELVLGSNLRSVEQVEISEESQF